MEIIIPTVIVVCVVGFGALYFWGNKSAGLSDMHIGQAMLANHLNDKWKARPADRNGPPIDDKKVL